MVYQSIVSCKSVVDCRALGTPLCFARWALLMITRRWTMSTGHCIIVLYLQCIRHILDHVKAVLTAQSRATRCIMGSLLPERRRLLCSYDETLAPVDGGGAGWQDTPQHWDQMTGRENWQYSILKSSTCTRWCWRQISASSEWPRVRRWLWQKGFHNLPHCELNFEGRVGRNRASGDGERVFGKSGPVRRGSADPEARYGF